VEENFLKGEGEHRVMFTVYFSARCIMGSRTIDFVKTRL